MFGEPEGETTEALGERVATLYQQLSRPSATRFKAALAKRGIHVPDAFVRQLVSEQGSRQLFAPPPRFTGKVVAQHVDERWAADVIDFQSKTVKKGAPVLSLYPGLVCSAHSASTSARNIRQFYWNISANLIWPTGASDSHDS